MRSYGQRSNIFETRWRITVRITITRETSPVALAALQTEVANLKAALAAMVNNEASLLLQLNDAKTSSLTTLETNPPSGGSTNPALTEAGQIRKVDPNPINGLTGPHATIPSRECPRRERVGSPLLCQAWGT